MARLLHRLGGFSARRRGLVVALWLALLVALGAGVATAGGTLTEDFDVPGAESSEAFDTLAEEFPTASGVSAQVVFTAPDGERITDPASQQAIAAALDDVADVGQVEAVVTPEQAGTISEDGTVAIAQAQIPVGREDLDEDTLSDIEQAAATAEDSGLVVDVGGNAYGATPPGGVHASELIGVGIALLVMVVTLGSLTAAGLPVLTALVGVAVGLTGMLIAASTVTITPTAPTLALMLGLAVGIDYALFVVSRHRSNLAAGMPVHEAIARATGTAGSAVVFAGATVVIALLGLGIAGIPFLTVMGAAAAATVAVAVGVAVTLLPAVLSLCGERLRPRAGSRTAARLEADRSHEPGARRPWSERYVRGVMRRPILVLVAGVIGVGALAVPVADLQLALPSSGTAPSDSTERQAYDTVSDAFGPGVNGPLLLLVDTEGATDPRAALTSLEADLAETEGVARVAEAQPSEDGDSALVSVIPETGPSEPETGDLVIDMRDLEPSVTGTTGLTYDVTGNTALNLDVSDQLADSLLPYLLVVVGLCFVLLLMVFRSIAVPLKATLGFLLSVGASLGVMVAVAQWGWGADLLGLEAGPVVSFAPTILLAVLFGLAMDYEVFLVSGMREEAVRGVEPVEAVAVGTRHSGRVVVAAAVIMTSVFGSFLFSDNTSIVPIALALAVGVVVDAFVVRMTLVPAVMRLLGHRAWWLPRWLDRVVPDLDVEGARLPAYEPEAAAVPAQPAPVA